MKSIKYLTQKEAIYMDELLLGKEYGYSSDQLMELAGLSISQSIFKVYPPTTHKSILTIAGPGNNGGDGLICSRHLTNFGYNVSLYYPKRAQNELYQRLLLQSKLTGVNILTELPDNFEDKYNLVIDAIFGYSFNAKGEIRSPFDSIIKILNQVNQDKLPICSVDIPSGWAVDEGNINNFFIPKMLISLASPKKCSENYKGIHYLGGRFIPKAFLEIMELNLPEFPGSDQCVDVTKK